MFRNYIHPPWHDAKVAGVTGECRVVQNEELLGFKTNARDSNWSVVIWGALLTMVVPGCEVLNFQACSETFPLDCNPDIVEVP